MLLSEEHFYESKGSFNSIINKQKEKLFSLGIKVVEVEQNSCNGCFLNHYSEYTLCHLIKCGVKPYLILIKDD